MRKSRNIIGTVFLVFFAVFCMFPFYWALKCSLETETDMFSATPTWFPVRATLFNYQEVLRKSQFATWAMNSFIVSSSTTMLVCVFACLAGYALAKVRFKGASVVFGIIVATMMLPKYSILVPLFQVMKILKWFNTFSGMVIPEVANQLPFGIFLIRQFALTLPDEVFESAKIDGCTEFRTFTSIAIPMIQPAVASLAIFTFVKAWNDYMWQLIVVTKNSMFTLPVGLATLQTDVVKIYGEILAGAMLSAVPLVAIFIVFQKYFIKGISAGAVKG